MSSFSQILHDAGFERGDLADSWRRGSLAAVVGEDDLFVEVVADNGHGGAVFIQSLEELAALVA